jgi:hypothetical protein
VRLRRDDDVRNEDDVSLSSEFKVAQSDGQ